MTKVSSRASLLLIEIIIAILIFSIAGAVCLPLFVKSHTLSRQTEELDMAVREASSVSELLARGDSPEQSLQGFYPDVQISSDSIVIYYDESFRPCKEGLARFRMTIRPSSEDRLTRYAVTVRRDDGSALYRMETASYRQLIP